MKNSLILFTRYPVPGKTKTRLIPALGEQGAADLQREMTRHTLDGVRSLMEEGIRIEVRYEGGDAASMAQWLGEDLYLVPQGEGDLGARMERAFRDSFESGDGKVVIIGSDCPDLGAEDVREAFILLDSNAAVFGPAVDGGYYLVGISSPVPERLFDVVFSGIPWGSREVLSNTVNALAAAGINHGLLDEKADVDEPEDLILWEGKIRSQKPEDRSQEDNEAGTWTWTRSKSGSLSPIPSTAAISVIIPALNEEERIGRNLERLKKENVEIIVADGGSSDGTVQICRKAGVKVVYSGPGRAVQMNSGALEATGEILLFLHADTLLPEGFTGLIRGIIAGGRVAGAFSFGTDLKTPSMNFLERAANFRARHMGIVFGDQAIFTRADIFRKIGGFPALPVMEDMELVLELKRHGRFVILPQRAITSARKWQANGVWRTAFMNQVVTYLYLFGISPERLSKWYRRELKS